MAAKGISDLGKRYPIVNTILGVNFPTYPNRLIDCRYIYASKKIPWSNFAPGYFVKTAIKATTSTLIQHHSCIYEKCRISTRRIFFHL